MRGDRNRELRWYMDINNLTDEVYSENVSVPTPRIAHQLHPRPPANVMMG